MPNPPEKRSNVYSKHIPTTVSWSRQIEYTFQSKDLSHSTEDVQYYRLPPRDHTFWFNFRIITYTEQGILTKDPLSIEIDVITADHRSYSLVSLRSYLPNKWYSMYWPIPAIYTTEDTGIFLQIHTSADARLRVELQGFEYTQPLSHHYVLVDENDRQRFLFKHEEPVRRGRIESRSIGSIHEIEEEDGVPTQGLSPEEVDGVPLFPMIRQEVVSWT
jgi:hypothetical protein